MTKTSRQQDNAEGQQTESQVAPERVTKRVRTLLRKGLGSVLPVVRWLGARHEWAMVLVTVGLLACAKAQWSVTAEQARISDQQTRLMVATQRSWVGPIDRIDTEPLKAGLPFVVFVTLKNAGQGPALQVGNSGRTVVLKRGQRFDPYAYELPKPNSRAVLLPGDTLRMRYESTERRALSQEQIDAIGRGDAVVYLIGGITYYDTLDQPQHHTRFSRVLLPGLKWSYWAVTKDGNRMD